MTTPPGPGPEIQEGTPRATPTSTTDAHPAGLDSAIELVRAAFVQAMREHGIVLGTRMLIQARADLLIAEALDDEVDETA